MLKCSSCSQKTTNKVIIEVIFAGKSMNPKSYFLVCDSCESSLRNKINNRDTNIESQMANWKQYSYGELQAHTERN